jgi:hypothetical protein
MKVVDRIQSRSLQERCGAKEYWLGNAPKYKAWKEANYGTGDANSRTGQMLSQKSLYGRTKIYEEQIVMVYGTNEVPDRAAFGSPTAKQLEQDQKRTDTEKAYFAHTGQSKKKIKRKFYEVDEADAAAVVEVCRENLCEYITNTNASRGY